MRTLKETQTKQIQKEINKQKPVMSKKSVVYKNTKTIPNFTLPNMAM